jgi:DNA-binding IclR family transcriptional regulator
VAHSAKAGRSVPPKILNVLQVIGAGGAQTVPDLAALTGLPEPVVDRWTRRLADWRLLEPAESGSYRAGLVLRLTGDGRPATESGFLPELSGVAYGRVRLGVLHGSGVAFVERRVGTATAPVATAPVATARLAAAGTRSPETTAIGHALLAFRSDQGAPSPVARQDLAGDVSSERALAVTRLSGVAITRRRRSGGGYRVAVPVLGDAGTAVVAIELTTPDLGDDFPSLLDALIASSRSTARRLALLDRDAVDDSAAPTGRP